MDFGSLVCTAHAPVCVTCPVGALWACAWRQKPGGDPDPAVGSRRGDDRTIPVRRFGPTGRLSARGAAACAGPIAPADLARVAGFPERVARARCFADALVNEGILVRLPGGELTLA